MQEFTLAELKRVTDACGGDDDATPLDEVVLDRSFDDLGYDSLAIYETVIRIREDLRIPIADEEIDTATTPREVIDLVNTRVSETAG